MGDIRVAALTAALLGWHGWPAVLLASILGVITAIAMLWAGRCRRAGSRVAMGPPLIGGAFVAAMLC